MKVKCIDNIDIESLLTMGKTYEVIEEYKEQYLIIDDENIQCCYYKGWFKPAISEMRNDIIDRLLK